MRTVRSFGYRARMRIALLTTALLGCAGSVHKIEIPTPGVTLLALSRHDHTLAIVDVVTLKVVARIGVGEDPHEVIASEDGGTAYVSNYGAGALHSVAVIDLVAQVPKKAIELGALRGPHGLSAAGGKIWFTAEAAKAIGSYDPAAGKVDWILGTGQDRTHMIAVEKDVKWMVTSNIGSATLTFVERRAATGGRGGAAGQPDWSETIIPVGRGAEGFDVSPDGREIWAANAQDGTVSVVDVATRRVTATLPADVNSANRLKFTPDGKLAVVSMLAGPDLVIIDAATKKTVKRLAVGRGAAGIQMQPDGARAFVACTPDDNVAVIDLKTLTVVARIDAGRQPDGMAWVARR